MVHITFFYALVVSPCTLVLVTLVNDSEYLKIFLCLKFLLGKLVEDEITACRPWAIFCAGGHSSHFLIGRSVQGKLVKAVQLLV